LIAACDRAESNTSPFGAADFILNPKGGKTCVADPTFADLDEEGISSSITLTIADQNHLL
jgi:hypothetical protein